MKPKTNFGDKINTAGFDKHPENIGNGRKKKIYTILKEKGYSHDDIKTAFNEMAFYTYDELKQVYSDKEKPVITRIIANQFNKCLDNGDWGKIKEIMEYTISKAQQNISINEKPTIIFQDISKK